MMPITYYQRAFSSLTVLSTLVYPPVITYHCVGLSYTTTFFGFFSITTVVLPSSLIDKGN